MFDWTIHPPLSTREKAAQMNVTSAALRRMRMLGTGPAYKKYSDKVFRYWEDGRTMEDMQTAEGQAA